MKSSEAAMLKEVWKRAYASPTGGLNVEFKTKSGAVRARMQLYNVVKNAKSHKDMEDLELVRAAEALEIVWVQGSETTLRLQKRSESDMLQSIAAALGVNAETFEDPAIKASREKLMAELDKLTKPATVAPASEESVTATEHQPNPFYTR